MKMFILGALAAGALTLGSAFCEDAAPKAGADFKTNGQKAGYSIGLNISFMLGQQLSPVLKHIDIKSLLMGIEDGLTQQKPRIDQAEMQTALQSLQKEVETAMATEQKANTEKGEKFLEANKAKPGVKITPSGLQYRVITEGTGKTPKATDTVKVNYKGTLIDGTEFDSSYKRNAPASFPVNRLIPGWTEALQLMKEGAKWEIVVPASLAYGERGSPPSIGPNETLVFEMELLNIEAPKAPAAAPEMEK